MNNKTGNKAPTLSGNKEKWVIKNSKELSNLIDKYLIPQELEKKITQK